MRRSLWIQTNQISRRVIQRCVIHSSERAPCAALLVAVGIPRRHSRCPATSPSLTTDTHALCAAAPAIVPLWQHASLLGLSSAAHDTEEESDVTTIQRYDAWLNGTVSACVLMRCSSFLTHGQIVCT